VVSVEELDAFAFADLPEAGPVPTNVKIKIIA